MFGYYKFRKKIKSIISVNRHKRIIDSLKRNLRQIEKSIGIRKAGPINSIQSYKSYRSEQYGFNTDV